MNWLEPNPPTSIPAMSPKPAPVNDDAYAAVLFDLRKKRECVAAELSKIDAAISAVGALV